MGNKFEIGELVYFIANDMVHREKVRWIREERYFGIDLKPAYVYGTETASYITEDRLHKSLESLMNF